MLDRIKRIPKSLLPRPALDAISYLRPEGDATIPKARVYLKYVTNKNGIEVGGPSSIFKYILPLYERIKNLDVVNFSQSTIWEGRIEEGKTFHWHNNKTGFQFIADGTDLSQIPDESYDFVLSSNCLEHIANPLKALREWKRILKGNCALILVLPNKISNFDHRRPVTSFEHILDDYNNNITEDDLTHLDEILELHDLSLDPPAGDMENFKRRSLDNFNNRTLHHHVFDLNIMSSMVEHIGLRCIQKNETMQDFFLLAVKDF
jgi:SAM-dependent methyltransferase